MIYVNKIQYIIKFKIKIGYYLELLMLETIKLIGSTKSKITKNEDSENVPHLEISEVILVHRNVAINNYQQNSIVLYTYVPINLLFVKYLIPKFYILKNI